MNSTTGIILGANWTQCPSGFVYPDDPNDPRNIYIQGTDCATACMAPFFTNEQYQQSGNLAMTVSAAGFAFGLILLRLWFGKSTSHYLIMTFIVLSVLTSLAFLVIFLDNSISMEQKFCHNNAVALDSSDGVSLCVVQGAAIIFLSIALCLVWLAQTIDLYLIIVRGQKGTLSRYFYHYLSLVFIYPSLLVIIFGSLGFFGYSGDYPYCTLGSKAGSSSSLVTTCLFYTPIVVILLLGAYFFVQVLTRLVIIWRLGPRARRVGSRSSNGILSASGASFVEPVQQAVSVLGGARQLLGVVAVASGRHRVLSRGGWGSRGVNSSIAPAVAPDDTSPEALESLRRHRSKGREITVTVVTYCLLFLTTWAALIAYHLKFYLDAGTAQDSYNAWVTCVFSNYDGISDDSWIGICGEQAEYYKEFYNSWYEPDTAIATGQSIIICFIFYREFVTRKWLIAEIKRQLRRCRRKLRFYFNQNHYDGGGGINNNQPRNLQVEVIQRLQDQENRGPQPTGVPHQQILNGDVNINREQLQQQQRGGKGPGAGDGKGADEPPSVSIRAAKALPPKPASKKRNKDAK